MKEVANQDIEDDDYIRSVRNHVMQNGGLQNYEIPFGVHLKINAIHKYCKDIVEGRKRTRELLGNSWKIRLLEGLRQLLGTNAYQDLQEVNVQLIGDKFKALCPTCLRPVLIEDRARNKFNAQSFYNHVETHFDRDSSATGNSDTDGNNEADNEMITSDTEQQQGASSSRQNRRQPNQIQNVNMVSEIS